MQTKRPWLNERPRPSIGYQRSAVAHCWRPLTSVTAADLKTRMCKQGSVRTTFPLCSFLTRPLKAELCPDTLIFKAFFDRTCDS